MSGKIIATALSLLFSIMSLPAQDQSIRFAFLTDCHYAKGSGSARALSRCLADVNTFDDLDFVMFAGDMTDFGTDEEIADVKSMLDSLKYKYYVVPGNHDAKWSESGCNTFRKVFGYETFEFSLKGWRFIGCSCGPDMRMAPALVPQESMEWLRGLEPGERTIFVNHYPQDTSVLNYFDVTRELKRIGTQLALGGHWHVNTSLDYDGLPGALGRSSLPAQGNPGYNIVSINGDRISISERRLIGDTAVLLEPWYEKTLCPVKDTVSYDSHGLPESYPWMRYDVNEGAPVKPVWQFRDNSNIVAGFAREKNRAWYATASGYVRCISLKDGSVVWSSGFPGKIFSTPAVSGKTLVFGCTDGCVYGLNSRNGKVVWKAKAGKSVLGSPVIRGGKVFIGASDGVFRALDLKTGKTVWEYSEVSGFVECRPYVDDQQVVFGTWANKLYSLNPDTGTLQWTWMCTKPSRMYSPAATWPVKSEGKIFIAVPDRRLYVLDAATGEELSHLDASARESVGVSPDGRTVYCKSMWHTITAMDASSLSVSWKSETGAGYEISPTCISAVGADVLMPTDKGNIVCFNAQDGSRLWAYKIAEALVNPMTVWEGKNGSCYILASTMDGAVTLLYSSPALRSAPKLTALSPRSFEPNS
ncbi:MAG: PQQ-binding-like beta-propeller repeat protein [Bacteroidales bacterium]|nr:PQQ-binding-like beta-propeller repeat protein [Bacteroidales bacterium]